MLQKVVYPYEYMDDWEKLNETLLPEKEDFYNHLNMEDITDSDCAHVKNLGEYHDLYLQNDILLVADVFRTFKICVLKYMSLILQNFFRHQD